MAFGAWGREFDPWVRRVLLNDLIDDIVPEVISFSTTDSHVKWRSCQLLAKNRVCTG